MSSSTIAETLEKITIDETSHETELIPLTKEELREKLKNKIKSSRKLRTNGITRKKGEKLNDSLSKVSELLANTNTDDPSKIDPSMIENIMKIIDKNDLEMILDKIKDDSAFKNILTKVTKSANY